MSMNKPWSGNRVKHNISTKSCFRRYVLSRLTFSGRQGPNGQTDFLAVCLLALGLSLLGFLYCLADGRTIQSIRHAGGRANKNQPSSTVRRGAVSPAALRELLPAVANGRYLLLRLTGAGAFPAPTRIAHKGRVILTGGGAFPPFDCKPWPMLCGDATSGPGVVHSWQGKARVRGALAVALLPLWLLAHRRFSRWDREFFHDRHGR